MTPDCRWGARPTIAVVLREIARAGIRNHVWLTADVHYTAAHHYAPERAAFTDFEPFWEFVSGPLNAGAFGPNALDGTFGPRADFVSPLPRARTPRRRRAASSSAKVEIDGRSLALTVTLRGVDGDTLYVRRLEAARR